MIGGSSPPSLPAGKADSPVAPGFTTPPRAFARKSSMAAASVASKLAP
jgi:hypothetical protein